MKEIRLRRGRVLRLACGPGSSLEPISPPDRFIISLRDWIVRYNNIVVEVGAQVKPGDPLATSDTDNLRVVSPVEGTVEALERRNRIIVRGIWARHSDGESSDPIPQDRDTLRALARDLGSFQILRKFDGDAIPRFTEVPAVVVIGTHFGDPFAIRQMEVLNGRLQDLGPALTMLHDLAGPNTRVVLTGLPDVLNRLSDVPQFVELVGVDGRFPVELGGYVAHHLEVYGENFQSGWSLPLQDVLALYDSIRSRTPIGERIIALAGNAVTEPKHYAVPVGTPLESLLRGKARSEIREVAINGALSGRRAVVSNDGVSVRDHSVTALEIEPGTKMWAWMYPGFKLDSASNAFASILNPSGKKQSEGWLRGERRACIQCSACEEVCPVDLLPHMLWKFTDKEFVDEPLALGIFRCIECGLCTYVCPSKIELSDGIRDGKKMISKELAED